MAKIFIVDDEPTICWGLSELATSMKHQVETFSSVEKALEHSANKLDLVIVDVRLPGMDGISAIAHFQQRWPRVPVIVITAYGNLSTAVEAIKKGAFDYIVKPFQLDHVQAVIERALAVAKIGEPNEVVKSIDELLVGSSACMNEIFKKIALASDSDASILIEGESGTGKELAARAIHSNSRRAKGRFVAVNIAALNPALAESELFGHVRGAFTGATDAKPGLLAQANGGTLFLDEVADIPESIQVKLLRALELKEFQPVGSSDSVKSDFRILSATHRNLASMVDQNRFRHDLFFRISSFVIHLPPLRDRGDDVIELANYFLRQFSKDRKPAQLSKEAKKEILARRWYGNVRELRNAMEQAGIVSRNQVIFPDHFPSPITANMEIQDQSIDTKFESLVRTWAELQFGGDSDPSELYEKLVAEIEKPLFRLVLEKNKGQYSAAARQLGIHRTTLKKKAEAYGILGDN